MHSHIGIKGLICLEARACFSVHSGICLAMPRESHCRAYYSNRAVTSHFTSQMAYITGMLYCNQSLPLPEAGVWAGDYVWVCLLLLVGHVMCE